MLDTHVEGRRAHSGLGGIKSKAPHTQVGLSTAQQEGEGAWSWSEAEPAHCGIDGSHQGLPVVPGAKEFYHRQMSSALDPFSRSSYY